MPGPSDVDRAADPLSPPALLRALSRHRSAAVRHGVAANPSVPADLLLEILLEARASEREVLAEAVLDNASLPLWLLDDPLWLQRLPAPVACAMIGSAAMTATLWTYLSGHPEPDVKLSLLRSAHAPGDAWRQLAFDEVLRQPTWRQLEQADLAGELARAPSLTPEGWHTLRGSWLFQHHTSVRLRLLLLDSPAAPPDAWRQLGLEPGKLKQQGLGPRDVAIAVRHLPHDTSRIDLSMNRLGPGGAEALAAWAGGEALTALDLAGNALDDAGAEALAAAACLRNVRSLDLWNNHISERGARALARSPHLGRVTELSLSTNRLGDGGVAALVEQTRLGALRSVRLRGNQVGPAGVIALARSPLAGQLEQLDLSFNAIDDASLGELASACDCLADLDLSTTAVSVAGLCRLLGSTRLRALRDLRLAGASVEAGRQALEQAAARRPGLRLHVGA